MGKVRESTSAVRATDQEVIEKANDTVFSLRVILGDLRVRE